MTQQQRKIVVITGASSGIGRAAARLAVRDGAHVVMVSKDPKRGARALRFVQASGPGDASLELADLALLGSVRELAERLRSRFTRIDVLVNNAGTLSALRSTTVDGFERTMATNYLAPFLLTALLKESLAAAGGRIVNVSSDGHRSGDLRRAPLEEILRGEAWAGMMKAYGDSKLALILFTREWMRRTPDVIANVLHPGVVRSRVWNRNWHPLSLFMQPFKLFMARPERGAEAVMRLSRPGVADEGGQYFERRHPARAAEQAYDERLAAELWDASDRLSMDPASGS